MNQSTSNGYPAVSLHCEERMKKSLKRKRGGKEEANNGTVEIGDRGGGNTEYGRV